MVRFNFIDLNVTECKKLNALHSFLIEQPALYFEKVLLNINSIEFDQNLNKYCKMGRL